MNSLWLLSYVTIIAVAAVVTFINVTIQTRGVHSSGTAHIKPQGVTVRTECHSGCLVGVFFFHFQVTMYRKNIFISLSRVGRNIE